MVLVKELLVVAVFMALVESAFFHVPIVKKRHDKTDLAGEHGDSTVQPHILLRNKNRLVKRDHPEASFEMDIKFDQLIYEAHLTIGSNKEKVVLLVDTGSSDMIVNSQSNIECLADGDDSDADNDDDTDYDDSQLYFGNEAIYGTDEISNGHSSANLCKRELSSVSASVSASVSSAESSDAYPTYPIITKSISYFPTNEAYLDKISPELESFYNCMAYGVYDQDNSTTFTNLSVPLSITYADGTGASGYFGTDDVYFGDTKIEKLTFGVNINTYKQSGVLGLGFKANQSPFQNGYAQYDSFPYRLKSLGMINKVVYSFYAPYGGSSSDSIIFGAYDSNGYESSTGLTLVPIINYSMNAKAGDGPYYISITLNSVLFTSSEFSNKLIASGNAPAILDLGTTSSIFPYYIFEQIIAKFGFQWSSQLSSYVVSESDIPKETAYVTFNFQNALIKVPVIDFTFPVIDGDTLSATGLRSISISYSEDDYFLLGDDFLSSAFFVVDLEEKNVALGQVNVKSGGSSVSLVTVTNEIIDAVKSSNWDYVYGYSGSTRLVLKEVGNLNDTATDYEQSLQDNLQLYIAGQGGELGW